MQHPFVSILQRSAASVSFAFFVALTGCSSGGGSVVGGPDAGQVAVSMITVSVGADGGSVSLAASQGNVALQIPAGALATNTQITITELTGGSLPGYTQYSSLFRFEPVGTTFAQPVTVTLPYVGDSSRAALFWSRVGTTGYDRIGGIPANGIVTGQITHFSSGFIADGIQYTDPPDKSCIIGRSLRGQEVQPSAVAMFFSVEDCQGRPITDLQTCEGADAGSICQSDFVVQESGQPLSADAQAQIRRKAGQQIFIELTIDMSKSTSPQLSAILAGAEDFITLLQAPGGVGVQIGIQLFAGDATLLEWQAPTLDSATLLSKLRALSAANPLQDFSSTNLNGAVIQALSRLATAEQTFNARNYGGALSTGYVVLFTGGRDTSGRKLLSDVTAAEANSSDQVIAIGFPGPDFNATAQNALCAIATVNPSIAPSGSTACDRPNAAIIAPTQATLDREFKAVAYRIAGQELRTYLLSYCSPARAGMPTVTVSIASATDTSSMPASFPFSAASFGPGCSATTLADACAGKQCGGLACGACDDRTAYCVPSTNVCASECNLLHACGGATVTNANGYTQACEDAIDRMLCYGQCRDQTAWNGACVVDVTTVPNSGAVRMSARSGHLAYWSYLGVYSAPADGGSPTYLGAPASQSSIPEGLTMDDQRVYWSELDLSGSNMNDGGVQLFVKTAPLGGGPVTYLSKQHELAQELTAANDQLFWQGQSPGGDSSIVTGIYSAAAGAGPGQVLIAGTSALLGVEANSLIYLSGTTIFGADLDGGSPAMLASGVSPTWSNGFGRVAGGHIAWMSSDTNTRFLSVNAMSTDGGTITTADAGNGTNYDIAVDQHAVYFGSSEIWRFGISDGSLRALVPDAGYATALAHDGTDLYWLSNGVIRKTPTP